MTSFGADQHNRMRLLPPTKNGDLVVNQVGDAETHHDVVYWNAIHRYRLLFNQAPSVGA